MSAPGPQDLPYDQLRVRPPAVAHYDTGMDLLVQAGAMGYGDARTDTREEAVAWFLAGLLKTQIDAAADESGGRWG